MSEFMKHQTLLQLQYVATLARRKETTFRLKAEEAEAEIDRRKNNKQIEPEDSSASA